MSARKAAIATERASLGSLICDSPEPRRAWPPSQSSTPHGSLLVERPQAGGPWRRYVSVEQLPAERRPLRSWLDAHVYTGSSVGLRVGSCVYTAKVMTHLASGGQLSRDPGPIDLLWFVIVAALVGCTAALVLSVLYASIAFWIWRVRSDRFREPILVLVTSALAAAVMINARRAPDLGWVLLELVIAISLTAMITVVVLRRNPPGSVSAPAETRVKTSPLWLAVVFLAIAAPIGALSMDLLDEDTPASVAEREIERSLETRPTEGLDISCPSAPWTIGTEFTCSANASSIGTIGYLVNVVEDDEVTVIEASAARSAERIIATQIAEQVGAALDPTCEPIDGWPDYTSFDCVAAQAGDGPMTFVGQTIEDFRVEVKESRIVDQAEIDEMIDGVIVRFIERRGIEIARDTFTCDPPPIKVAFGRKIHCDLIDPGTGELIHSDLWVPEIEGDGATIEFDVHHGREYPSGEPDN